MIKNFVYIKNPVYPFFYQLAGKEYLRWDPVATPTQFDNPFKEIGGGKSFFVLPWRLTMNGVTSKEFVGPLFLLLLPWVFFVKEKERIIWWLLGFALLAYGLFLMATHQPRYLMPVFPALSILAAYGLVAFSKNTPKYFSKLPTTICVIFILLNLHHILSIMHICYSPFQVLTGLETRVKYLSTVHFGVYPDSSYKVIKWVNDRLSTTAKVLLLGEEQVYYFKKRFAWNHHCNRNLVAVWAENCHSGEDLKRTLDQQGVTHILVNTHQILARFKFYFREREDLKSIFNDFWGKYIKCIYTSGGTYLYEILFAEEAKKPHSVPINFLAEFEKRGYKPGCLAEIYREYKS